MPRQRLRSIPDSQNLHAALARRTLLHQLRLARHSFAVRRWRDEFAWLATLFHDLTYTWRYRPLALQPAHRNNPRAPTETRPAIGDRSDRKSVSCPNGRTKQALTAELSADYTRLSVALVVQGWRHSTCFGQHRAPSICRARTTHIVKFRSISRRHEVANGREALCGQNVEFHRDSSFPLALNSSVG